MRSHSRLAIPLNAILVLGGCGGSSGLHGSGGTTSGGGGTGTGQGTAGTLAGATASGGLSSATVSAGGGVSGSMAIVGGSSKGGSSSATAGTTTVTGGRSGGSGGASATGGTSTSSPGGSSRGGTASASGTTSTTRTQDAGAVDGGIVASGFCEGDRPKLNYQGQALTPAVTDYESNVAMDCCNGYGVNLHSTDPLGFDVAVELILSLSLFKPGEYDVGGSSSIKARALTFKSSDATPSVAGVNSQGKLRVFAADGSAGAAEIGLCLEVTDGSSPLSGTKLYVPRVLLWSYESSKRFQIYLLKDSSLPSSTVSKQSLDSLVLADSPLLDLNRIAYVEKATGKIGFNPGQKFGSSVRTQLGTPMDRPFVVVADGERIYLGAFTSQVSSIAPTGPFAYVEDITADDFTLHAPVTGTDPRNDERILKALSERGKLVP